MIFLRNLFLLILFGYTLGECIGGCKEPTLIYEGLKCTPVFAKPDDCCPFKYDCSHYQEKTAVDTEKCLFHGKLYNEGESINNDEVFGSCRVGCFCTKNYAGELGFTCAFLDCPRISTEIKPGCHLRYEFDKCCPTEVICPPFNATCEVSGKVYHEGEQFDNPENKCTKCICEKRFEGKFEAPFCRKQQCFDEIDYQTQIRNFCAPSYRTVDDCCAFKWICPINNDNTTITHTNNSSKDDGVKCKFGDRVFSIGDSFVSTREEGKFSCSCRIPPFLTCFLN